MSRSKDQDQAKDMLVKAKRASNQQSSDFNADHLRKIGHSIGNEAFQNRLEDNNFVRDDLLDFLCNRLRVVREIQQRELTEAKLLEGGFNRRAVADTHKEGISTPEPTQWRLSAQLYADAAYHLCQGDLSRGSQLLEAAVAEEQRRMEALTELVSTDNLAVDCEAPVATQQMAEDLTAGACKMPEGVQVAHEISSVTKEIKTPGVKPRTRDPWWGLMPGEGDEDDDDSEK